MSLREDVAAQYAEALVRYLEEGNEAALADAYDLGRRSLGEGLSILDVVGFHQHALATVARTPLTDAQAGTAKAAGEFLSELLSPFEMTFRGYREANLELRRMNELLARQKEAVEIANGELEAFSYSVSHDLGTPLRAIDGFSQVLVEDCADRLDEEGRKHLRLMHESAQVMGRMIEDLLALARLSHGKIVRGDIDLTALARELVGRLEATEPGRRVEFQIEEGLQAQADNRFVPAVLQNLLGNAWKYTSKRHDAQIAVGRHPAPGASVYFVRDNGAGFDMALSRKLFVAFQRLHSESDFTGHGIGLATVQRIVRRHGGKIWAEAAVGQGATFYFTFGE